ncbi:radical SAM protein [Paenibacillus sp. FSL R7-0302]|uniref:radical SAM protein n=1 Tax=Paenibacillus sp. FSL R7-0302 TaxID=2921681 RepID=UPI0030FC7A2F
MQIEQQRLQYESISIELTKQCNLECPYCYSRLKKKEEEHQLTTEQLCFFLEKFRSSGGRRVLFTGGEALLRTDFKTLVLFAKSQELLVDLFSNGTLIDEDYAEFISKHINMVNISLDGPLEYHDRMRGNGSYEQTIKALSYLAEQGAHVALQCMVTPESHDDWDWLKDIILHTDPVMVKLGHVSRMGRGKYKEKLWLTSDKILDLKSVSGILAESHNHFHTRITTNVITKEEYLKFYPTLENVLSPWMLPDGNIMSCYVHHHKEDWAISNYEIYPQYNEEVWQNTRLLEQQMQLEVMQREYFDMLELSEQVASRISSRNRSLASSH